jgi:hypothetical protein
LRFENCQRQRFGLFDGRLGEEYHDLHDSISSGPVKVIVNKKEIAMGPGTQILLTRNQTASFESLNPRSCVGYRRVKSSDLGGGIKSFVCDFSIAHSLSNMEVLHSLLYSQDSKHKRLVAQMTQNLALLALTRLLITV